MPGPIGPMSVRVTSTTVPGSAGVAQAACHGALRTRPGRWLAAAPAPALPPPRAQGRLRQESGPAAADGYSSWSSAFAQRCHTPAELLLVDFAAGKAFGQDLFGPPRLPGASRPMLATAEVANRHDHRG